MNTRMSLYVFPAIATLTLLFAATCLAGKPLTVYTVNYPLAYFTERIGGEFVEVVFPTPAGVDPAFWTPDGQTISGYQKADLIILNGAGYAKWAQKVSLPLMRQVDTSKSFKDEFISSDTNVTHSHGPEGDHSHTGTAFTTWLDFSLASRQAEAIYKSLSRKIADQKPTLQKNFETLKTDLLLLDKRLQDLSNLKPALPLLGSHPIYQYLARRYGLNLRTVMWEPDEDPGEQQWRNLQTLVEGHAASWMLWENSPRPESVERLKEMGIRSLVYSPCFNRPNEGNFLTVMQQNVDNLTVVFTQTD
ncbi:MAG: metal ABC transporter substrate-binding protein [Desulfocapsaceae bacterium]